MRLHHKFTGYSTQFHGHQLESIATIKMTNELMTGVTIPISTFKDVYDNLHF